MPRLYNADVIECEDYLYESLDALIEYAKNNPSDFVVYKNVEVDDVKINDNGDLQIDYSMDDIDENDNDIIVHKSETFSYKWKGMMTLVA